MKALIELEEVHLFHVITIWKHIISKVVY
ncbi:MAG: hypothetical protein V1779_06125 [bacterium]